MKNTLAYPGFDYFWKRSLIIAMMILSTQGQLWYQAALAQPVELTHVGQTKSRGVASRGVTETISLDLMPETSPSPVLAPVPVMMPEAETKNSDNDDDDGIFCCLGEILLLAGLVLIGVLGANAIMWLIKQNPRY